MSTLRNSIRSILASFFILFATTLVYGQAPPANDSCHNSIDIVLGQGGYEIGTFRTDSIHIDSATKQVGEYFHSSLVSSGNDKKSMWFRFYIPARRGIKIELKQNANAIGTKDCGFTTYFADQCLPTSTQATAAKLTTLNQFGSSFHPCMDPGWYIVQVSAKSRAAGKLYLEITTSYPYEYSAVVNAEYDEPDSAYDFGDQVVGKPGSQSKYIDYELGCYSITDSTELFPDIGPNHKAYTQSAWFVFTSNQNNDDTQLKFKHVSGCSQNDTMAIRLFKGDARSGGSLQLLDSSYHDWSTNHACRSSCYEIVKQYQCLFDSGEVYSVQLIYHKDLDKTMRFSIFDQTSLFAANPKPLSNSARQLDTLIGQNTEYFGFSCESKFTNSTCGNVNSQPVSINNWAYNLNEWMEFDLASYSNLDVRLYAYSINDKNHRYLGFRLFKDSATTSCGSVDTSNIILEGSGSGKTFNIKCLEPGRYIIQLLGTDTVWQYSSYPCLGTMHLGGDYRVDITAVSMPDYNRFSLKNAGDGDSINNLNPLGNYTTYTGGLDTVTCWDAVLPLDICDTSRSQRKAMYRTFVVSDSGMVHIGGIQTGYRGSPYRDYNASHRLYRGNALDLRSSQSVSQFPDTLLGLQPTGSCLPQTATIQNYCLTPGAYTFVSMFDEDIVQYTEKPTFRLQSARSKFDTYAKTEFIDSITSYGNYYGAYDTMSCHENPDTIDGVTCGVRNTYHTFYLDSSAVVRVQVNYWYAYYYLGATMSLFKGDIRNGKSSLKLYDDGLDWSCVYSQQSSDCRPMEAGWYTVVVSNNFDIGYDSARNQSSARFERLSQAPIRVEINSRAPTVIPPKYFRPSKAAFVDSLINNNQALSYDTNYSSVQGMHLNLKSYTFPREALECDLDTPLNHFPNSQLCDTATTNLVYYTFTLAKDAYVKIWGKTSGSGTWKSKMYNFDVRKDSAKLATSKPVQDCNYNANYLEFCNLQAGTYSVIYFCKRTSSQSAYVQPTIYIDSVATSRFDHAQNAYDFGNIPGDGKFYDGKIGTTHPSDTALPPSHDMITCRTGGQLSDPTNIRCYSTIEPLIYKGDTNVSLYPYDSSRYTYSTGATYNPYSYSPVRNLWYSFVIEGRGTATIKLNGLNSNLIGNTLNAMRFAIYESDEDGSLSVASLKASGKIDSTISDGLTHIDNSIPYYCYQSSQETVTFWIEACGSIKPRRYFVMVETYGYNVNVTEANVNQNVWLEIKYDSITVPDTKFDYYSSANKINGLNDVNLLVNGDFELNGGWSTKHGHWQLKERDATPQNGYYHGKAYSYYYYRNDTVEMYQSIDLTNHDSLVSLGSATMNFSGYIQSYNETTPDQGRVLIDFLNSSGGIISNYTSSWIASVSDWQKVTRAQSIPTNCKSIVVRLQSINPGADNYHYTYFDNLDLRITVPDNTVKTTMVSEKLYQGEKTYFSSATIDSTDFYHHYNSSACTDSATGGSVWYKFVLDSSGYIHYNYVHSYTSGTSILQARKYGVDNIRLYRSTIAGDSITGLTYVAPSRSGDQPYRTLLGEYHLSACVSPGTYYLKINKCTRHACQDYVIPQIAMDYYPATPTKYDYYSTANVVNDVGTKNKVFASDILYEGDSSYFIGATLDTTDHNTSYNSTSCKNANAKTIWYKLKVDSSGYMYYNYRYQPNFNNAIDATTNIRVFRSDVAGDSINGLTYIPRIWRTYYNSDLRKLMSGYASYICVQPGEYYVQINSCGAYPCVEYVTPQFVFDFHTGDLCETAVPLQIDTLEKVSDRLLVNCHSIGTDFGEDGSDMGCLFGPKDYKSSWFKVDYTDTTKVDLEFKLAEYTDAKASEIRYRTYYGNCKSLTSAPCNNNALTTFTLDCIRKGTYYIQIVTPDDATGELEMSVEAKENTDTTCNPVDIFQPNAAFYYNTNCPENVIQFVNTSSKGDSIRYEWDFGYGGLTDTVLNPIITYPASSKEQTYTVTLLVENVAYGSRDSIEIDIDVPYAPDLNIVNNDTNLCEGDSITLTATLSHGKGIWGNGDTSNSITVNKTGTYVYTQQDKPKLLTNGSFEVTPSTSNDWNVVSGTWTTSSSSSYNPQDSSRVTFSRVTSGNITEIYQDVDVSFDSVEIDSGLAKTSLSGLVRSYPNYPDEAQLILEYYNASNVLVGQFQSGFIVSENSWQLVEHSRTTPKGTRRLRVRVQANKVTTIGGTYSYAFFDKLILKMRSLCTYKDSVYIQVNPYPILSLPTDTIVCRTDSVWISPSISYNNPYVIQDSMNSLLAGTLKGDARHTATNGYVDLTSSTVNAQNGQIEWEDSTLSSTDSFTVNFDYFSSGKNEYALWFNMFNHTVGTNEDYAGGGYSIGFDASNGNTLQLEWNNGRLSTTTPGMDMCDGNWHNVQIKYNNQSFKIYFDNQLILTYTDASSRTQVGYKFGIGARSYYYNNYRVKNFHVSKNNDAFVVITPVNQRSNTYTWNDTYSDSTRWGKPVSTYTLQVTDKFGCKSNSDTMLVDEFYTPDSLFTADENICSLLDSFYLTKPTGNGYFYGNNAVDSVGLILVDSAQFGNHSVYFTLTDTNGCIINDTANFIVDSVPEISFNPVDSFCKNDSVVQLVVNHNDGFYFGGSFVDSFGVFNPSMTSQRVNRVYYQTNSTDCQAIDSIDIVVDSIPDARITTVGPFCENAVVATLAVVNTGGRFTPTAYLDTTGQFDPGMATAGSYKVFYSITDGNGCSNTDSSTIVVDSIPSAAIDTAGPFCENAVAVTLAVTNAGGRFTPTTYLDTAGKFDPSIAKSGSHKIFYSFTDGKGCSNTDSTTIVVDSIPIAAIDAAGPFCENAATQSISGLISGGRFTPTSYLDTAGQFDPSIATAGSHRIFYSITDGNGCSNTDSSVIVVDSIPSAAINAAGPFCENGSVATLSVVNSGGRFSPTSYLDTTGQFDPSIATSGSYKIFYSITDGNGCSNTDSTVIVVDSIPSAAINTAGPFCENASVATLGVTNSGGRFTPTTYLDTTGQFDPSIATSGNHKIFYSFTDGNGCSNTDSTIIVVDSIPNAAINSAGPFCENSAIQTVTGVISGGRFTPTSYLDTVGQFDPSIATSGSYKIFYSITDGNGCSNTDSTAIVVDSIPNAAINAAGPFCENAATQSISGLISGGRFTPTAYLDTTGQFDPSIAKTGSHKVFYSITDGNGCSNTDSATIVIDSIPSAAITAAGPFCENSGVATLVVTNSGGRFSPTTYLDTTGQFDPSIASSGSYKVFYSFTDGNGCSNTDSTIIVVDSIPNAAINSAGPFCENSAIQTISGVISGGRFTPTTFLDTTGQFDPGIATSGSHKIFYSITDGKGCSNTDSSIVVVDSIPNAAINTAGPFCVNDTIQSITGLVSGGRFTPTAYLDTTGQFDPSIATSGSHKIFYSITDGKGCSTTDSSIIVVDSIPSAAINTAGPFCENAGVTFLVVTNSGGRFTPTTYLDTAGQFDPSIATSGSHKVFYSITDGKGCSNTDSTIIIVDSIPNAAINAAGPYCENSAVQTISGVIAGGRFSPTTYLDTAGRFDPSIATSGSHKIFYSITDGKGCSNTDSTIITVDTLPNASIIDPGNICLNGGTLQISPIHTGGRFSGGMNIDTTGLFDPILSGIGSFNIYYTLDDGAGCTNVDSLRITVDSIPNAAITSAGPFCENGSTQSITGLVPGGRFTPTTYLDTTGLFEPSIALAGSHKVFYSITDGNGCSDIDSTVIIVDSIPNAAINSAGPFCENASMQSITGVIPGGRFTPTAYLDTIGQFDPSIATSGSHKIFYSITDGEGCSNTDSSIVVVDSIPSAAINSAGPFCENASIQSITGLVPGGRFTPTAHLDMAGQFDPSIAMTGSHKVYYSITDGNGCSNTDSIIIVVDSIPSAAIIGAGPFCENASIQSISSVLNGGRFTPTAYLDTTGQFDPGVATSGSHKIFYSITDGKGCSNTDSTIILVDSIPNAAIHPAGPFCENASTQSITGVISGGRFTPMSYLDTTGQFDPSLATSGNHKIFYSITDGNGCSNTDSTNIVVLDLPNAGINSVLPICQNAPGIQLSPNTTGGTFSGGSFVTSSGFFDPQAAIIGRNKVIYSVTDINSCTASDSMEIEVLPLPTNRLTIVPAKGCEQLIVNASTETTDSIYWTIGPNNYTDVTVVSDTFNAGIYPVTLTVWSDQGCSIQHDTTIEVFAKPTAAFDYTPKDIYISSPTVSFQDLSTNIIVNWLWDFGDNQSSLDQDPIHDYTTGGSFPVQLFVTNNNGCIDSTSMTIVVKDELLLFIPTGVSPNGDGLNDIFQVSGAGYTNIKIQIFNRWGERIYESDDFTSWDATYKGDKVQMGSYMYIMSITDNRGRKYYKKDSISVIR